MIFGAQRSAVGRDLHYKSRCFLEEAYQVVSDKYHVRSLPEPDQNGVVKAKRQNINVKIPPAGPTQGQHIRLWAGQGGIRHWVGGKAGDLLLEIEFCAAPLFYG